MNVSISQIVEDLDTTIQGVQLAITAYTLVMAALMLAGAKLGDILGRDKDVRDRPGDLRRGLADHRAQPQPRRAADRLVARRGDRRRAGDAGDRVADRRHLQRPAAGARLRDRRRRRRRRDRRRAADRRLGHDRVQLALRLRRRDGGRHRDPAAAPPPAAAAAARDRPQLDVVGVVSRPGWGWSSSASSRAARGA